MCSAAIAVFDADCGNEHAKEEKPRSLLFAPYMLSRVGGVEMKETPHIWCDTQSKVWNLWEMVMRCGLTNRMHGMGPGGRGAVCQGRRLLLRPLRPRARPGRLAAPAGSGEGGGQSPCKKNPVTFSSSYCARTVHIKVCTLAMSGSETSVDRLLLRACVRQPACTNRLGAHAGQRAPD